VLSCGWKSVGITATATRSFAISSITSSKLPAKWAQTYSAFQKVKVAEQSRTAAAAFYLFALFSSRCLIALRPGRYRQHRKAVPAMRESSPIGRRRSTTTALRPGGGQGLGERVLTTTLMDATLSATLDAVKEIQSAYRRSDAPENAFRGRPHPAILIASREQLSVSVNPQAGRRRSSGERILNRPGGAR